MPKESHHSHSSSSAGRDSRERERESRHHRRSSDRVSPAPPHANGSTKERRTSSSTSLASKSSSKDHGDSSRSRRSDEKPSPSKVRQEEEKENPEPSMTKKEFYEAVSEYENGEAEELDVDKHLEASLKVCKKVESLMEKIYHMKRSGDLNSDQFLAKKLECLMLLTTVRRLNRLFKLKIRIEKDKILDQRNKVDLDHLRLQNLIYEATHLQDQVAAVQDYKGMDREIELIPVEQFYKEAPERISKREMTSKDEHLLKIARLEYEYVQRQNLSDKCVDLEKAKNKISEDIAEQQGKLDKIGPILTNILEAARPLEEYFDIGITQREMVLEYSRHLPTPLYILYVASTGYSEFLEESPFSLKVKIGGSLEAARKVGNAWCSGGMRQPFDEESPMDIDEDEKADQDMEIEKEHRKRSKRRLSKHSSVIEEKPDARTKLLERHPFHIQWTLVTKDGDKLELKFYYMLRFRVVTVVTQFTPQCSSTKIHQLLSKSENILSDIFENDEGLECPNSSSSYLLNKLDLESFSDLVSEVGYSYKWAQHLCGLEFLGEDTEINNAVQNTGMKLKIKACKATLPGVYQLLLERLNNKVSLIKTLKPLETGTLEIPSDVSSCLQRRPAESFVLSCWEPLDFQQFQSFSTTVDLLKANVIRPCDVFVRFLIERGPNKITALFAIPNDYPEEFPTVVLHLKEGEELKYSLNGRTFREMEQAVNVTGPRLFQQYSDGMLKIQLRLLIDQIDNIKLDLDEIEENLASILEHKE